MGSVERVRPPAVAGLFYPADAADLGELVDGFLSTAADDVTRLPHAPKVLVVPHAGFVYSGAIAASAYVMLRQRDSAEQPQPSRVVLLGPAHRAPVQGLAASSADAWRTPLGDVPIDDERRERLLICPGVSIDDDAHASEHSLEVQVPFLQRVLGSFRLLPLLAGHPDALTIGEVLDACWGGPETLIVVSTDLSHYLDYATASARDQATATAIIDGAGDSVTPYDACGAYPLRGLLAALPTRGLQLRLLDLRNSGDTAGDRSRVVGYGAFASVRCVHEPE